MWFTHCNHTYLSIYYYLQLKVDLKPRSWHTVCATYSPVATECRLVIFGGNMHREGNYGDRTAAADPRILVFGMYHVFGLHAVVGVLSLLWCMSLLILIVFWHGQGTVQLLLWLPGPSLVLVPKPYQSRPCRLHQLWSWSSPSVLIYWFFTLQVPKVLLTVAFLWSLNVKPWCHTYLSSTFLRTSGGKLWKHWKPRSTVLHLSLSLLWETRHESYKLCLCIHICCHFLHANILGPNVGIICHSLMLFHHTLSVAIIKAKINALAWFLCRKYSAPKLEK